MAKGKRSKGFKALIIIGIIMIIAGAYSVYKSYNMFGILNPYKAYKIIYEPNVELTGKKFAYLYIRTDADFNDIMDSLISNDVLKDTATFNLMAIYKDYKKHIKPGKYLLTKGMNNKELVNMLKSGRQEPVKLVFNNVRTKYQLAGKIAKQIEADSISILNVFDDDDYLKKLGFTSDNCIVVFIPDTYEMYWKTSASQLFEKMNASYKKFWTAKRLEQAKAADLTPIQVEILASIVQEETAQYGEMPTIAGLYINRLNKGMKLEADPTVKFAIGDFTIKRVLKRHLETDSPYNTYKVKGLPPGPISLPDPRIIDKTLAYEHHKYIYMCAKEDFSGFHNFAKTAAEHAANARKYQNALNAHNIR
jgi:UPF0755 protein